MNEQIRMHDIVALLEDTPARHFLTGGQLLLRRGQMGTVVMTDDGATFEVEFAGRDGRAFAAAPGGAGAVKVLVATSDVERARRSVEDFVRGETT